MSELLVIDGCQTGVPNELLDDGCTMMDEVAACAADSRNTGSSWCASCGWCRIGAGPGSSIGETAGESSAAPAAATPAIIKRDQSRRDPRRVDSKASKFFKKTGSRQAGGREPACLAASGAGVMIGDIGVYSKVARSEAVSRSSASRK